MTNSASRMADVRASIRARSTLTKQTYARRFDPVGHELLYQSSYFELARRTRWLEYLPMASPGGGTASFSQLYLLLRVLTEARGITRVLELGAGISTSLITQWVAAHDAESVHVDDDEEWLKATLPGDARSTGVYAPLANTVAGGKNIKWYDTDQPAGTFDLVLVDGPQAWNPESRFNRLGILNWMPSVLSDEFVVVVDDSSRPGEHQLVADLADLIERGGQPVHRRHVVGGNSQTLLASDAHRFAAYL